MSQTEQVEAPRLPPAPDVPGPYNPDDFRPAGPENYTVVNGYVPPPENVQNVQVEEPLAPPQQAKSMAEVEREISRATSRSVPVLDEAPSGLVYLPGGWMHDGQLVQTATVRELNGYHEEKLARLVMSDNPAIYLTELLYLGVEDLGGSKPTKADLRELLIGDRDALWIGVRIATYGKEVEYTIECSQCETDDKPTQSIVTIDLEEDVPVKHLDDPMRETYDVDLRNGVAKVKLLNGEAQEKFSTNIGKKTQAEVNTIMLAHSVLSINGIPTKGSEDAVRSLSSADRFAIMDFILATQPGPQLATEIEVHCSKCDASYPIYLSPTALFRF